ncbi:HSP70/90 co-chaperone [Massospora cicadina]|nr:HSP70/90 co-chaperone [Massospora cicadina]
MDQLGHLEKVIDEVANSTTGCVTKGPSRPARPDWAFTEENFLEEMDRVPLFMKNLPKDAEENTALAALQTLKFDGTPEENASNFKALGNECFNFGKSRYRDAIQYYTQALDQNSPDTKLNVACLINRAAVNLDLENYGRVLSDCSKALQLDPKTSKLFIARQRLSINLSGLKMQSTAANVAYELMRQIQPDNSPLKTLLERAKSLKQRLDEKERIKAEKEKREAEWAKELEAALQDAKIQMIDSNDKMYKPNLKSNTAVRFDKASEFKESDFIERCEDGTSFLEHLEVMFEVPAPWDSQNSPNYTVDSIEIYFESFPTNATSPTLIKVGKNCTIRQVLAHPKYFVVNGVPSFILLSNRSAQFKEEFIARYRK